MDIWPKIASARNSNYPKTCVDYGPAYPDPRVVLITHSSAQSHAPNGVVIDKQQQQRKHKTRWWRQQLVCGTHKTKQIKQRKHREQLEPKHDAGELTMQASYCTW